MKLLTDWDLIPAGDEDEIHPSSEGWGCVALKSLNSQQAAAPARGADPGLRKLTGA